jgi:chromate reductase, NAD(P)H dehydrogenase (quinone)
MRILAISGSLRAASSNTSLLRAAQRLCPIGTELTLYRGLEGLPHFNPDLDGEQPPLPVVALRQLLRDANALLLSSPEYAFGIPGSFKNALDWVVSSGELYDKPTGLINAGPGYGGAMSAQAALLLTLKAQGARVDEQTTLSIAAVRTKLDAAGNLTDPATVLAVRALISALTKLASEPPPVRSEQ